MYKNKLIKLSRKLLEPFGMALTRGSHFTADAALKRCRLRGLEINTVIDVGASDGRWTDMCLEHYPDARYLLVEAQAGHRASLERFCNGRKNVEFVMCAAGNKDGKIYFNDDALLSGVASETPVGKTGLMVDMHSIDTLVERHNLKPPYLIKLDTHGFEVPIIDGCGSVMDKTNLFVIETYNYKISDKSLKYYEMCMHMEALGFRTVEIVDLMSRLYDSSLWQMDMFFVPAGRKEFSYDRYR